MNLKLQGNSSPIRTQYLLWWCHFGKLSLAPNEVPKLPALRMNDRGTNNIYVASQPLCGVEFAALRASNIAGALAEAPVCRGP